MPTSGSIATKNPLIYVNDVELPKAVLEWMSEMRIELELRLPGRVTMRFQDPQGTLATNSTFALGARIQIKPLGGSPIIDAEITGLAYEASTGAGAKQRFAGRVAAVNEFVVTAHDRAHRLTRRSTVAGLTKISSSDLVKRIADNAKLTPQVTATTTQFPTVTQVHNDFELLNALADREGFDWWVGPGHELHFKAPQTSSTVSLDLGTDQLESFSVSATALRPDKVSIRGWDNSTLQTITGNAAVGQSSVWPKDVKLLSDFPGAASSFQDAEIVAGTLAPTSASESTSMAKALADRIAAGSVVARGVGEGNANITIGSSVKIQGSKPVAGTYHVTKVEHIVRPSSYKTKFTAGDRAPTSLVDVVGGSNERMQFPLRHFGVVTAIVDALAGDPKVKGDERGPNHTVRVSLPGLDGQLVSAWGRFLAPGAGGPDGRGLVALPEVGDEVLVAFENGDVHRPVILGGLYSQPNKIGTWDVEGGIVMSRRFRSRNKHLIEIKDGNDNAANYVKIEVERTDEKKVLLNLAGDKVELTAPQGEPVTVKAGDSKIEIAANGDISIEAPNITVTGKQKVTLKAPQIELKADQQLSLSSSLKTELKGATVDLASQGPMTVKGMPVKVN